MLLENWFSCESEAWSSHLSGASTHNSEGSLQSSLKRFHTERCYKLRVLLLVESRSRRRVQAATSQEMTAQKILSRNYIQVFPLENAVLTRTAGRWFWSLLCEQQQAPGSEDRVVAEDRENENVV